MRGHLLLVGGLLIGASAGAASPPPDLENRVFEIALHESERATGDWDPGQRDCAGFVRYVFRKALGRRAADLWKGENGEGLDFASAEVLLRRNFKPLGRAVAPNRLRSGDVLVFYAPEKAPADRYHLMMVLRSPTSALQRLLLVYHNGAARPHGMVKRVWWDELQTVAGPEWAANETNDKFKGAYRWDGW